MDLSLDTTPLLGDVGDVGDIGDVGDVGGIGGIGDELFYCVLEYGSTKSD